VTLATLGLLRGGFIAQEVSVLLGCLNRDVGSLCGTEFRETNPLILVFIICNLLKFLFLTRILGLALDLLVTKVLITGSGGKRVETSLQTLKIPLIYFWLRFDWSSFISAHFSGVLGYFFGILGSCRDFRQISENSEGYR
jgi:hypothetical protein